MVNDSDAPAEISEAHLEQWYRVHNGKDMDGRSAGIGIQARDKLIRRLIDEVRALRQRGHETRGLISQDTDELQRLRSAVEEIGSGKVTGAQAIEIAKRARRP